MSASPIGSRGLAIASLAATATLLSGCGFHLVGNEPLPPPLTSVYVEVIDPYHVTEPPIQEAIQAQIVRRGGVIKSKHDDAQSELRLYDLKEAQEVLSFGPDGKAIEYRLITRISYELRSREGLVLVAPETQAVTRDYSFNATQILPKEAESDRLQKYIQEDLAGLVLLRISAQLRAFAPVPSAPVVDKTSNDANSPPQPDTPP